MTKLSYIIAGIACAFLLWIGLSWLDVVTDNAQPGAEHSQYNAFVLLVNFMEDGKQ